MLAEHGKGCPVCRAKSSDEGAAGLFQIAQIVPARRTHPGFACELRSDAAMRVGGIFTSATYLLGMDRYREFRHFYGPW